MAGILFVRPKLWPFNPTVEPDAIGILNTHGAPRVARAAAVGYDYVDVNENVVWDTVEPYLKTFNFDLFVFTGHGSNNTLQGDRVDEWNPIISTSNMVSTGYLVGKAVYAFACNAGSSLMYHLYDLGAVAVAGFVDTIRMVATDGSLSDAKYISTSAGCFKFLEALIDGRTWYEARNDAILEWNRQYEYWFSGDGASDFGAADCAVRILEQKINFMTWPLSSEYALPAPSTDVGTISVTTDNANATFTLTGPAAYDGSGLSWTKTSVPVGSYTITYDSVSGFITPDPETLVLTADATIEFTASYVSMSTDGTIVINTNVANSIFTVTGATKSYSGTGSSWTTTAPAGDYTVSWGPVAGYTAPVDQTKTVATGETTTFIGAYVVDAVQTGTLAVTTNNANATFTLIGPETYAGSGTSWSQANAPIGSYTIIYGAIAGYNTPPLQTKELYIGGTTSFNGVYSSTATEYGTIVISTNNASASFTVVGPEIYSGFGTEMTQTHAPVGSYTITYGNVAGYTTPSPETLVLADGGLILFTGNYVAITGDGYITVTANIAGASFTISGPEVFYGYGQSWSTTSATPGSYTIVFEEVAGYIKPANQTKTISSGVTTYFTCTYTVITGDDGTIYVTSNIAAALFVVEGPETFSGSGTLWSTTSATPGFYTVYFYGAAGYNSPSSKSGTLSPGGVLSLVGYYTPTVAPGGITVSTNLSSASFTISGPDNMSGSGTSWSDSEVTPGDYTITYGNVAGYTTPSPETQTVAGGATTAFTGTYAALATVGTIVVNTNISASFTLTGPTTYTGSGTSTTQTNAPIGTYTIAYGNVAGYTTPAAASQVLTTGGTITFAGTYAALAASGTIVVATNNDSASFTVIGANTYSGTGRSYTTSSAPVGLYTITFGSVPGYYTPTTRTGNLMASGTLSFSGTYNRSEGASASVSDVADTNGPSVEGFVRKVGDSSGFRRCENRPTLAPYPLLLCLPSMPVDTHLIRWEFKTSYDVNSSNVWAVDQNGITGTALAVQNERGGVAKSVNGAEDNNYYAYSSKYGIAKPYPNKGLWLNTGIRFKDVDEADWFFGLSPRLALGSNIFDDRVDAIGFFGVDGSASINSECSKDSVSTQETGLGTLIDLVFTRLHIYVEGTRRVHFYINGKFQQEIVAHIPDDEEMCVVFGCRNGKREANEFTITQINLLQDI